MNRLTWIWLSAGAGAGVWLALEHDWLAWVLLSTAAIQAVGVLAYCMLVRQLTGRRRRIAEITVIERCPEPVASPKRKRLMISGN